jgi:hypothetical protein
VDRREFIRLFVLGTIGDDYENIDQIILPNALRDGARCGVTINRGEIVEALAGLIENGFAKAYMLWGKEPFSREIVGMPDVSEIEEDFETYFYITDKGLEFHLSNDSWWPFDEDDNLRPNRSQEAASGRRVAADPESHSAPVSTSNA